MTPDKKAFLEDVPQFEAALRVQHTAMHGSYAEVEKLATLIGQDALCVLYRSALRQRPQLRSPHHRDAQSSNVNFCPREAVQHGLTPAKVRKQMADSTETM